MVLESILFPAGRKAGPLRIAADSFLLGIIFTSVAIMVSLSIFPSESSLLMVFFTTIAMIPIIIKVFQEEEKRESSSLSFSEKHGDVIKFYSSFFLGTVISMSFWFSVLPEDTCLQLFDKQLGTIEMIRGMATGDGLFSMILENNLKVLILSFLLSFIYGSGAVFLLTWNASVIAAFVGGAVRGVIGNFSHYGQLASIFAYLHAMPASLLSIALHGIPEFMAYFVAAIAGGILSVALLREKLGSPAFNNTIKDSIKLMAGAVFLILLAAWLEVAA